MWYQSRGYVPLAAADGRLLADDDREYYQVRRGFRFDVPSRAHGDFAEDSVRPRPRRQQVAGVFPPEPLTDDPSGGCHGFRSWTAQRRTKRHQHDQLQDHDSRYSSHPNQVPYHLNPDLPLRLSSTHIQRGITRRNNPQPDLQHRRRFSLDASDLGTSVGDLKPPSGDPAFPFDDRQHPSFDFTKSELFIRKNHGTKLLRGGPSRPSPNAQPL